jgi:hypothetical protein
MYIFVLLNILKIFTIKIYIDQRSSYYNANKSIYPSIQVDNIDLIINNYICFPSNNLEHIGVSFPR